MPGSNKRKPRSRYISGRGNYLIKGSLVNVLVLTSGLDRFHKVWIRTVFQLLDSDSFQGKWIGYFRNWISLTVNNTKMLRQGSISNYFAIKFHALYI
jgi:hypothetical protein